MSCRIASAQPHRASHASAGNLRRYMGPWLTTLEKRRSRSRLVGVRKGSLVVGRELISLCTARRSGMVVAAASVTLRATSAPGEPSSVTIVPRRR
eukprot:1792142-Pyramimonas_sp.AAC.1